MASDRINSRGSQGLAAARECKEPFGCTIGRQLEVSVHRQTRAVPSKMRSRRQTLVAEAHLTRMIVGKITSRVKVPGAGSRSNARQGDVAVMGGFTKGSLVTFEVEKVKTQPKVGGHLFSHLEPRGPHSLVQVNSAKHPSSRWLKMGSLVAIQSCYPPFLVAL